MKRVVVDEFVLVARRPGIEEHRQIRRDVIGQIVSRREEQASAVRGPMTPGMWRSTRLKNSMHLIEGQFVITGVTERDGTSEVYGWVDQYLTADRTFGGSIQREHEIQRLHQDSLSEG